MDLPIKKIELDASHSGWWETFTDEVSEHYARINIYSDHLLIFFNFKVSGTGTIIKPTSAFYLSGIFNSNNIPFYNQPPAASTRAWASDNFFMQAYGRVFHDGTDVNFVLEGSSVNTTFENVAIPSGAEVNFIYRYDFEEGVAQ